MATLEELLAQAESEVALSQPVGTPAQRALQAGAGTALNIVDPLTFGLLGKGLAAGQAIASDIGGYFTGQAPEDYYSQELAKIERLKSIGQAAQSEAGLTGPSEALSFMAPLPGKKAEALFSIAKPVKEAGLGLASYLGSEAGQAYTNESPYGSLAGALAAPLSLQGLVGGIRRLSSALSPTLDVLKGREEALQQIASKEVLKAAGEEGAARLAMAQQMPELLTSPLGRTLTAAEIAQTPGIANVQLQMAKNIEGGKPLIDALTAGKAEQELAMAQLGSFAEKGDLASTVRDVAAKQRGAEILGNENQIIKNIDLQIQSLKPETIRTPSELVKSLGTDTAKKIKKAKDDTKATAREAFRDPQVYNVIVDVPNIRKDVSSLVKRWKRAPTQTIDDPRVAKQIAKLRMLDMPSEDLPKGFVPTVKIGDLHTIQVKLGEVLSGSKPDQYTPSQALALSVWQYVDGVMEKAPGSDKLFAAKAKSRDYFDTFIYNRDLQRPSPLSQALKKSPEKVLPFLSKESFGVSSMQKASVGLDNLETLKLSEFANLPDAKKKLAWIEKNRPQLSDTSFWPQMENYAAELKGITQPVKRTVGAFENITEGQIPTKIFGDENAAAEFMKQFRGTEAELLARGKWIQQAKTARGGLAAQYDSQKKVVKRIFGSDTDKIEKIIKDIDLSNSPQRIAQIATGKQSITTQGMTTIGWLLGARSMLKSAKGLKLAGPAYALANWTNPPAWLAGGLAYKVGEMATKSDAEIDRLVVEMLRDPSLIKFAASPVSEKSTKNLLEEAGRLGYFGAKSQFTTDEDELAAQELLNSL